MKICKVRLDWSINELFEKDPSIVDHLKALSLFEQKWPEDFKSGWYRFDIILDLHLLDPRVFPCLESIESIRPEAPQPVFTNLNPSPTPAFNQLVNVCVPGYALLEIAEVGVKEDCCTDELGRCLLDGWKILAICPQPDQRRPDYVLGRPKPAN